MFKYCDILFKKKDSPGWIYAIMSGDKEYCERICKSHIKEHAWLNYKLMSCNTQACKPSFEFKKIIPNAHRLHQTSDLIYIPSFHKVFLNNEIIPEPNTQSTITKKFEFIIKEISEMTTDENEKDYFTILFSVKTDNKQTSDFYFIAEDFEKDIPKFISNLKSQKYANIIVEEFNYCKFLAWDKGNHIRFIIQNYDNEKVKKILDVTIDKKLFLDEFVKISCVIFV